MKTFQEYIQYCIDEKLTNSALLDNNKEIRLLTLINLYFEYCLIQASMSDEVNANNEFLPPLGTVLEQYAIACEYLDLLIRKKGSEPISQFKSNMRSENFPLQAEDVDSAYNKLNENIVTNIRRVSAQFKFENHSSGGRVITNPKKALHYFSSFLVIFALDGALIKTAFELHIIPHFLPLFFSTSVAIVSAFIVFACVSLFARYGYERYRTVPLADEITEIMTFPDLKSPEKAYQHVYYAHDYYQPNTVSESLFKNKQRTEQELVTQATQPSSIEGKEMSTLISEKITHNVLLTHYQQIYSNYNDYKKGKGLLETGMTGPYIHARSPDEENLFRTTPYEPKVNITQLNRDLKILKRSLNPSFHS